jgi:hypothetical protein
MVGGYRQSAGLLKSGFGEEHLRGKLAKLRFCAKPKSQLSDNLGHKFCIKPLLAQLRDSAQNIVLG